MDLPQSIYTDCHSVFWTDREPTLEEQLINSRGRIPEANIAAVTAALDAGVQIVLVTGRSFPFARRVVEALPPTVTLIASNGAIERTLDACTPSRGACCHVRPRARCSSTRASSGTPPRCCSTARPKDMSSRSAWIG